MTDQRANNCTICILLPLALGIGALILFYFISRDSIANAIQSDLAYSSNQLLKENQVGNVAVSMNGRDAILKGSVTSEERSLEIESIVASMSGIRSVDNQLEIVGQVAAASEPEKIAVAKVEPLPEIEPEPTQVAKKEQVVEELLQTLDLSGINFLFGNDEITEQGKLILDDVAKVLAKHKEFNVVISGHTDSVGDDKLNLHLSQQRAQSVLNYLSNNGIRLERLSAIGYGETNPIADNSSAAGRAINRRIEFEVSRK